MLIVPFFLTLCFALDERLIFNYEKTTSSGVVLER